MLTALIFIIVIGVLVFVHEFGHFIFAKRAGMRVEEFGFGFPPRLWGIKKGETLYSINLIPFGGFVKIYGEDGLPAQAGGERGNDRSFTSRPIRSRLMVVMAGVLMNFLFAALLLMVGNFLGLRVGLADSDLGGSAKNTQVQILQVADHGPAQEADIRTLDEIKGFRLADGTIQATASLKEVQDYIIGHEGQAITLEIQRGTTELFKDVTPRKDPPAGEGPLGISLALTGELTYPWYESIWRGLYDAGILFVNTLMGYGMLFKSLLFKGKLLADVSGPVGIATLTGQAARVGINYLIQFVAVISMNLAVLNIIPFPALDGGRAALLIVEKIRGIPLNKKVEGTINAVGFALLLLLMVVITFKDVAKFF